MSSGALGSSFERSVVVHSVGAQELTVTNVAASMERHGTIVGITIKSGAWRSRTFDDKAPRISRSPPGKSSPAPASDAGSGHGTAAPVTPTNTTRAVIHAVVEYESVAMAESAVKARNDDADVQVSLLSQLRGLTITVPSSRNKTPSPSPHGSRRATTPTGCLSPRGRSRATTPTPEQLAAKQQEMEQWSKEHVKAEHSKLVGETLTGRVATAKGSFGFITPDFTDKLNLFFHSSNVKQMPAERKLRSDDEVSFKLSRNGSTGKLNAVDVVCIREAPRPSVSCSPRTNRPPNIKIPDIDEALANPGMRSAPSAYRPSNPWSTSKIPEPFSARGWSKAPGGFDAFRDARAVVSQPLFAGSNEAASTQATTFVPPLSSSANHQSDPMFDVWESAFSSKQIGGDLSASASPPRVNELGAIGSPPNSRQQQTTSRNPMPCVGGGGFGQQYQRSRSLEQG